MAEKRTVVHGDFRADNLLFEGLPDGGDLAFIDWHICWDGCGIADVGYHLTQSMEVAVRLEVEQDVVRSYHRTPVEHGVTGYDFDECWEDYRTVALGALSYAINLCGSMDLSQERARTLAKLFLDRSLAALKDLNAGEKLPS